MKDTGDQHQHEAMRDSPADEAAACPRRRFFRACLGGMGAMTAGLTAAPVATFLQRPESLTAASTVKVPLTELGSGEAIYREVQGSPVVIVPGEGMPKVFSASCSHLGCIVRWEHDTRTFICPCHGAIFDATGKPLKGPTNQPLPAVNFEVKEGVIIIG